MSFQSGYNLIELMVGLAIGLFVTLGLLVVFENTRMTLTSQSGIALVQQKQMQAATVLSSTIQSAGYFPIPTGTIATAKRTKLLTDVFPPRSTAYPAGSSVFGTDNSLSVRFQMPSGSGMFDCVGGTNSTGVTQIVTNVFSVRGNALMCSAGIDGSTDLTTQTLVSGIRNIRVSYGIDTTDKGVVSQYVPAASVSDWTAVRSVQILLTYINPLAGQPGQPGDLTVTQVIRLMANT